MNVLLISKCKKRSENYLIRFYLQYNRLSDLRILSLTHVVAGLLDLRTYVCKFYIHRPNHSCINGAFKINDTLFAIKTIKFLNLILFPYWLNVWFIRISFVNFKNIICVIVCVYVASLFFVRYFIQINFTFQDLYNYAPLKHLILRLTSDNSIAERRFPNCVKQSRIQKIFLRLMTNMVRKYNLVNKSTAKYPNSEYWWILSFSSVVIKAWSRILAREPTHARNMSNTNVI